MFLFSAFIIDWVRAFRTDKQSARTPGLTVHSTPTVDTVIKGIVPAVDGLITPAKDLEEDTGDDFSAAL